ncbi:hypothetical protein ACSFA3_00745 [Variovorax sp. RHLX14]|uniref:hypothetical protein n=1 Tax=Variovorax sp. RHLX14 TaxID=1259731 RepID=UPI003F44BFD0
MKILAKDAPAGNLVSYYLSAERDVFRSRSVGDAVLHRKLDIPALPARLLADWERETSLLGLESGDVESLPLPRARLRWPDYGTCVRSMSEWIATLAPGLGDVLADADIALMTCRGARYHHDGAQYGGAAFCNLFLSEDKGVDLHFPGTAQRIPLARGTAVVFDTGQPHAVIDRRSNGFSADDFPADRDCGLVFLTWELPMENAAVADALGVAFDVDPQHPSPIDEAQVRLDGQRVDVCAASGRWTCGSSAC